MERRRHRLEAEAAARDVDGLHDAPGSLGGEREQAVVGPDEPAAVPRAEGDGPPLRADIGINDGEMHADRHVGDRLGEDERAGADVVAIDPVGEVDDAGLGTGPDDHPVADADEVVGQPIVRQEGDDRLVLL